VSNQQIKEIEGVKNYLESELKKANHTQAKIELIMQELLNNYGTESIDEAKQLLDQLVTEKEGIKKDRDLKWQKLLTEMRKDGFIK
jgi:polyhydroxyalkanoate synthesis regulator phasin